MPKSNQRGSALLISLFCISLLMYMAAAFLSMAVNNYKMAKFNADSIIAVWLAEAGVAEGISLVRDDYFNNKYYLSPEREFVIGNPQGKGKFRFGIFTVRGVGTHEAQIVGYAEVKRSKAASGARTMIAVPSDYAYFVEGNGKFDMRHLGRLIDGPIHLNGSAFLTQMSDTFPPSEKRLKITKSKELDGETISCTGIAFWDLDSYYEARSSQYSVTIGEGNSEFPFLVSKFRLGPYPCRAFPTDPIPTYPGGISPNETFPTANTPAGLLRDGQHGGYEIELPPVIWHYYKSFTDPNWHITEENKDAGSLWGPLRGFYNLVQAKRVKCEGGGTSFYYEPHGQVALPSAGGDDYSFVPRFRSVKNVYVGGSVQADGRTVIGGALQTRTIVQETLALVKVGFYYEYTLTQPHIEGSIIIEHILQTDDPTPPSGAFYVSGSTITFLGNAQEGNPVWYDTGDYTVLRNRSANYTDPDSMGTIHFKSSPGGGPISIEVPGFLALIDSEGWYTGLVEDIRLTVNHPVAGTGLRYINEYTLNNSTGIITFNDPPGSDVGISPYVEVTEINLDNINKENCPRNPQDPNNKDKYGVVFSEVPLRVYGTPRVPITIVCKEDIYLGDINKGLGSNSQPVGLLSANVIWADYDFGYGMTQERSRNIENVFLHTRGSDLFITGGKYYRNTKRVKGSLYLGTHMIGSEKDEYSLDNYCSAQVLWNFREITSTHNYLDDLRNHPPPHIPLYMGVKSWRPIRFTDLTAFLEEFETLYKGSTASSRDTREFRERVGVLAEKYKI